MSKLAFLRSVIIVGACSLLLSGCNILDKKNVAGLQVITSDIPSALFLDGQYLDKSPYINKTIKPGTYTLSIQPENSELTKYETQIVLRKGLLTVVTWKPGDRPETSGGVIYEMEQIKSAKAELSFVTVPDNAIIKLDEAEQQFSPVVAEVEPGHHQFQVSLPSYDTQKHTINAVKGHRTSITIKLAKSVTESNSLLPSPAATASGSLNQTGSPTSTPSANQRIKPGSVATSGATVTIKPTNFFQNNQEVLRVRTTPSAGGAELGFAPVGETYPYLGETTANWYKIQFDNQMGWVSSQFATLKN